jgi:hypothetical protein
MHQTIQSLGQFGSAVCESDGTLVAFFANDDAAALAACAPGQVIVPSVITRSGIVPAPAPQPER